MLEGVRTCVRTSFSLILGQVLKDDPSHAAEPDTLEFRKYCQGCLAMLWAMVACFVWSVERPRACKVQSKKRQMQSLEFNFDEL